MSGARVEDIDIFRSLKIALIKFRQVADTALLNADSQIVRTLSWLENEQVSHWSSQIRKRTEKVSQAADAVRAKTLFKDATGRTPDAFREQKMLRLAQAQLAEAESRLSATKRAIPKLQKEIEVYRGGVQGLGSLLVSDLPRALAMIERIMLSLEEYVNASTGVGVDSGSSLPSDAAMPSEPPAVTATETTDTPKPEEEEHHVPG